PGEIQFTLIFFGANSNARDLHPATNAPFVIPYMLFAFSPTLAITEVMKIILIPSGGGLLENNLLMLKAPYTLVLKKGSILAGEAYLNGKVVEIPAAFIIP